MSDDLFNQPTLTLAQHLLGKTLVHETKQGVLAGYIVETEAYIGPQDRAAHSFAGRRTARTEVMYDRPGLAYIYLIYGIHICFNVVSGSREQPEAVLIRALEPSRGLAQMAHHRRFRQQDPHYMTSKQVQTLTNGPGKLTQALHINRDYYGHDLSTPPLYIETGERQVKLEQITSGPRVGIENTGEARFYPWRFWIKGHPYVSHA